MVVVLVLALVVSLKLFPPLDPQLGQGFDVIFVFCSSYLWSVWCLLMFSWLVGLVLLWCGGRGGGSGRSIGSGSSGSI